MTRRLIGLVERLPLGDMAKRAFIETLADHFYERRGGVMAAVRVAAAAIFTGVGAANPFRFIGHDARAAVRRLRGTPAYFVFSALTLAVAIGATTAIYSVVYAAMYRQQPIPQIDQVVNIYQTDITTGIGSGPTMWLSFHDLADLEASQTAFSSVAAWSRFSGTLITNGASESLLGEMVTGSYFSLLGVNAALGRGIQPADEASDAASVLVLSDGLWRRMFGADPSVIGRTVRLQGQPFQIVGVAPAWFRGSDMPNLVSTPAWIPLRASRMLDQNSRSAESVIDRRNLSLKARLRPGVTVEQARTEVTTISRRIAAADPERRSYYDPEPGRGAQSRGWFVLPVRDIRLHESVHRAAAPTASALMAAVLLVLLVGCSNLANLALARAARRRQEIAVRIALGASRLRIVREQLVESSLVALVGWGLGLLVALGLMQFFAQSVELHAAVTITLQLMPTLNMPVFAVSLGATGFVIVVVGIGPAFRQTHGAVRAAIAADGLAVVPRWRFRGTLVAGQVATSVLLVAMSTLCLRELQANLQHDPGFALDELALLQLDFSANKYERSRVLQELGAISDIVGRTSGVQSVSVMSALPIGSGRPTATGVGTPERPPLENSRPSRTARSMAVAGPVFDTLGVRLVSGRALASADDGTAANVVVISESLAKDLYPNGAVGQPISLKRLYFRPERPLANATIVGVVADTDTDSWGSANSRQFAVYLPLAQTDETYVSVVARTSSPARLSGPMREAMRGVDGEVAIISADTGFAVAGPAVMVLQVTGSIAGALGGFALILAVAGLYGVLADVVARRTREIGIRVALGAARESIHRMVLVDGLKPVAFGAIVGLGLAYLAFVSLPAFVFLRQLRTAAPQSLALSVLPLAIAAAVACYLPARRASRVDPNVALREL